MPLSITDGPLVGGHTVGQIRPPWEEEEWRSASSPPDADQAGVR